MKTLSFALILLACCCTLAAAQEFEIKKYDVNAKLNIEGRALEVTAKLRLVNLSPLDLADRILLSTDNKPRLSFFLDCGLDVEYLVLGRVCRRIWAIGMRDTFKADPRDLEALILQGGPRGLMEKSLTILTTGETAMQIGRAHV